MAAQKRIGIVGCGSIGRRVATEVDQGGVPGIRLAALHDKDVELAETTAGSLSHLTPVLPIAEMVHQVDLVVETATGVALDEIAITTLSAGKDLMAMSCGALLDRNDLFNLAREKGATIYVPSGAIAGLDGVASAAVGRIDLIRITTRKPPGGLLGAPGVAKSGVNLDTVTEPTVLYDGPVTDAVKLFPANVNVSAALSLAGVGPHETTIRIFADPTVERNTHEIEVEGEFGKLGIKIEGIPSPGNPRTGVLSALSVLATLRRISSHLRVGT
jgi:aspartate dehydrogenase